MQCQAVVFDLDGTLIDSLPSVHVALNQALGEIGRSPLPLTAVRPLVGHGARFTVEGGLAASGAPGTPEQIDDAVRRFVAAYLADPVTHTIIYPGVIDVLKQLAGDGIALGICTNKPQSTAHAVLAGLDLEQFFTAIACGDGVPYPKPDARHVMQVVHGLAAVPAATAFVGDSEIDMAAARNAGLPAVAVTYGYCRCPPEALDARAYISKFAELPTALTRLFRQTAAS
jgi:phosphoglycolate phosphatase